MLCFLQALQTVKHDKDSGECPKKDGWENVITKTQSFVCTYKVLKTHTKTHTSDG